MDMACMYGAFCNNPGQNKESSKHLLTFLSLELRLYCHLGL